MLWNIGQSTAPLPVRLMVAVAAGLLLVAVSVALSPLPVVGAYWTVTVHVFFGPRLVAAHVSAVFVNAADPDKAIFSALVAEPPEFLSVNVWVGLSPIVTRP